ncbi:MAG TPA: 50S ribosomal protein L29 [Firmicutes bacterium]|nr:50S ribosomal protein L29 [Bacillota bacterium]
MTLEEMRKMTTNEIDAKIVECKNELFSLRMQQSSGMLRETHKITEMRKTIARLKTIRREKEMEETDHE